MTLYVSTAAFQWIGTAVIVWRAHARGISSADMGLAMPKPALTFAVTVGLTTLIAFNQLFSLKHLATQPPEAQGIMWHLARKVFPQSGLERAVFSGLVLTVAICEEVIYRGFAQRAFENWSGGMVAAGIVGSALLFGVAHLYQGRRGLVATSVVGLLFSAIRAVTGSLGAVMIAHFATDTMAGFLAPSRLGRMPQAIEGKGDEF